MLGCHRRLSGFDGGQLHGLGQAPAQRRFDARRSQPANRQWHGALEVAPDQVAVGDDRAIRTPVVATAGRQIVAAPGLAQGAVIGRGSTGKVYEAVDTSTGVHYALKQVAQRHGGLEHIKRNFALTQALSHPHIAAPRFLLADPKTGEHYLVMDLVTGSTLLEWFAKERQGTCLPIKSVLAIAGQIASALDHAHGLPVAWDADGAPTAFGVLHCNLKPTKVMVELGRQFAGKYPFVRLTGLGQAAPKQTTLLGSSMVLLREDETGSPMFMAPEQFEGKTLTPGVDQWALAVLIYFLVENAFPFSGKDTEAIHSQALAGQASAPTNLNAAQWSVLLKALHPDRRQRHPTCTDLVRSLGEATKEATRDGLRVAVSAPADGNRDAERHAPQMSGHTPPIAETLEFKGTPGKAPAPLTAAPKKTPRIGNYQLIRKLGEGAMGVVYLAEEDLSKRQVALKVLTPTLAGNRTYLKRFYREARLAGSLNHTNTVSAYAAGEDKGQVFYAMEYCEGETLQKLLKRHDFLAYHNAVPIISQAAKGLQHAHDLGLIHRDIKPANIMLCSDGTVKVLDMGLARPVESALDSFKTETGAVMGTPHYMSPEQVHDATGIDERTDIYSLGATLFHLLTGRTPYLGSKATAIMLQHVQQPVPDPRSIRPEIPEQVAWLVMKMMAKKPEDRFDDCDELVARIERVQTELTSPAVSDEKPADGESKEMTVVVRRGTAKQHPVQRTTRAHSAVTAKSKRIDESDKPSLLTGRGRQTNATAGLLLLAILILPLIVVVAALLRKGQSPRTSSIGATEIGQQQWNTPVLPEPVEGVGQIGKDSKERAEEKATRLVSEIGRAVDQKLKADDYKGASLEIGRFPKDLENTLAYLGLNPYKARVRDAISLAIIRMDGVAERRVASSDFIGASKAYDAFDWLKDQDLGLVLPSLEKLTWLCYEQGQSKQAEPLLNRVLPIFEKFLGPHHTRVAALLSGLAIVHYSQGQYVQAEPLFRRALAICEKVLDPDHPDVATSLNNLALVHYCQGQFAKAEPLFKRSLSIYEKVLEPEHLSVAAGLSNLALVYYCQDQYAQAEPLFRRVLSIYEKALGPDHSDVATCLEILAAICRKTSRDKAAVELEKRAAAIRGKRETGTTQATGPQEPEIYKAWPFGVAEAMRRQKETADRLGTTVETALCLEPGDEAKLELVLIPAGRFEMGSNETEKEQMGDEKKHWVALTKPFWVGKYEVTQKQYVRVMDRNPAQYKNEKYPVEQVSWWDAQAFCREVSQRTGRDVRLLTEEEWEYACRAGTATPFSTGDRIYQNQANYDGKGTTEVGLFQPNAFGLCDMHGNVWEWCKEVYGENAASGTVLNPTGEAGVGKHVFRGGSWKDKQGKCRSAYRHWGADVNDVGFRVAVTLAKQTGPLRAALPSATAPTR